MKTDVFGREPRSDRQLYPAWKRRDSATSSTAAWSRARMSMRTSPSPWRPARSTGVLATHAHIDHTGLLPLLVRNGFRGRIYATNPTVELCGIMLRDSAHIQEFEAEWKNRKGQRSGAEPVEPMYTIQDAEAAIAAVPWAVDYDKEIELAPGHRDPLCGCGPSAGLVQHRDLGHRERHDHQAGLLRRHRQPRPAYHQRPHVSEGRRLCLYGVHLR